MRVRNIRHLAILASVCILVAIPASAEASHSWGGYHWARTANPFTVKVIDSMTTAWDDNLDTAIVDWDKSAVLNPVEEAGDPSSKARKRCATVSGKIRVCNSAYGNNGWLGLAQIWVTGSHITQAVTKMNDTYLASSAYSETNRQHVVCQEVGHAWGLDHQDESGADRNTCMDYSRALDNPHPNQHDYEQLVTIYSGHVDASATTKPMPAGFANANVHAQENWGRKVHESTDGRSAVFVRRFGSGLKVITHVTWAP
jgi:hypothetical protein